MSDGLETLGVEQLRQLARVQAEKLNALEGQLALMNRATGGAGVLSSFVSMLIQPYGIARFTSEALKDAPNKVHWYKTAEGFVVWTDRLPPPPPPPPVPPAAPVDA